MNSRYVILYGQHGHPLAAARGELAEHRAVLYAAIGPGSHPCHFCGKAVAWRKRGKNEGPTRDDLHVEHLDGDTVNNDPSNLVPVCQPCNVSAGYSPTRIRDDETRIERSGLRLRADARTCEECQSEFLAELSNPKRFCSRACANEAARKDESCGKGHPRTLENTYEYKGTRRCRPCQKAIYQAYRERKKAARSA